MWRIEKKTGCRTEPHKEVQTWCNCTNKYNITLWLLQKQFIIVKRLISPHFLPCPLGGAMSLLSAYLSHVHAIKCLLGWLLLPDSAYIFYLYKEITDALVKRQTVEHATCLNKTIWLWTVLLLRLRMAVLKVLWTLMNEAGIHPEWASCTRLHIGSILRQESTWDVLKPYKTSIQTQGEYHTDSTPGSGLYWGSWSCAVLNKIGRNKNANWNTSILHTVNNPLSLIITVISDLPISVLYIRNLISSYSFWVKTHALHPKPNPGLQFNFQLLFIF